MTKHLRILLLTFTLLRAFRNSGTVVCLNLNMEEEDAKCHVMYFYGFRLCGSYFYEWELEMLAVLGNHDYRGDVLAQLSPSLRKIDSRWLCLRSFVVNAGD